MIWLSIGVAVALILVYSMCDVAKDSDRQARRKEKAFNPYSDVDITGR